MFLQTRGNLQRKRLAAEPGGNLVRKMRREGSVNLLVVGVQPVDLGLFEEILDNDRSVEVAEGQGLEFQPAGEIILTGLDAQE